MRIFRHYDGLPDEARNSVVAIGNFDGVHLGHQAVIGEALALARRSSRSCTVVTFEPHPREFFAPDAPPFRLTTLRLKAHCVEALGVVGRGSAAHEGTAVHLGVNFFAGRNAWVNLLTRGFEL